MTLRRLPRGSTVLAAALLVTFVFLFYGLPGDSESPQFARHDEARRRGPSQRPLDAGENGQGDGKAGSACPSELRYLNERDLALKEKVLFSRHCVRAQRNSSIDRDGVAEITAPLSIQAQPLELATCEGAARVAPCETVHVQVPVPYPDRSYDDFIFGVSSLSDRLHDSADTFATWLAGSKAKLLGIVADSDSVSEEKLNSLREAFKSRGIDAEFVAPSYKKLTASKNHFAMVRDLLKAADDKVKWIGILDDDTYFPSLYPLVRALSSIDHTKEQYVGTLSEDFRAVRNWGYMAFGGAGVFLSVPTAKLVDQNMDRCLEEGSNGEGDGLLRDCIYRHTHAKLTPIQGLYQQDMMGDVSGFFESGIRPISLHHWKSWYHHPVDRMAATAKFCGDCFLQRWRWGDKAILTNGYSISVYSGGTESLELDRMEQTWGDAESYEFSLGPFRDKLSIREKKAYLLVDTELLSSGSMRQVYVYRTRFDSGDPDEVIELMWEADGS